MLRYIRFFLIIHILLTGAAAIGIGLYLRKESVTDVEQLGEMSNLVAAKRFVADLWPTYHDELMSNQIKPQLQTDLQVFQRNAQLAGLRLYDANGTLLYTTGGTTNASEFMRDTQSMQQGGRYVFSNFTTSGEEGMEAQETASINMVRSLVGLKSGNKELFVELFTDVSDGWHKLLKLQLLVCGSIVAVAFLMLIGVLMIYRKAETVIAVQHEKNVELEAQAKAADEQTKQKSLFLAGISHELRTPLNAIIGFSDIIKNEMMGEVKNPQFAGYINDIHSSGVHLLSLINDILDFSKAEAGKLELEVEEINATKVASNSLRLVQPRAEAAGVILVNSLPKEHFVLETDGKKFKQILLNLLSNAVKFTPSGGKVSISGWHDLATDAYVFQVTDTGIGIAQKDIAKAMAPFGQVDNALSRKYEGTGLGLPLTRKFIELMGGKFSIKSEVNKGTTITFNIPRTFKAMDGVIFKKVS